MAVVIAPERRRLALAFVFATVLVDMIGIGLIIPVLPALIGEVGHVDLADAAAVGGWMYFAYSVAQFFAAPVMGNLSDAYGRRPLLLLAIGGLMVDYIFHALAPTLALLFVGRVIAGICGASWVIANAYIADVTEPEERARAFGMVGAAFGVGFVIGPALGGLLGELGPRVPFWVAAALSGANLIFGWLVLPESLPKEKRRPFEWRRSNPFGAFRVFSAYPVVLPLCTVLFVFFFASSIYPAIWPFWGMARFGWSEALVGLTLAAFGIVTAVAQGAFAGPLARAYGERRVVFWGLVIAIIAAVGYGLAGSLAVVLVLILLHAPEGFVHPMLVAIMSKEVPENAQGELQGGLASLTNVAMLAGTLFFSQLFRFFMSEGAPVQSSGIAFFVAAGFLGLALALYVLAGRPKVQPAH